MSEGKSWKTPTTVIGIITVLLTAAGVYISKRGSDLEIQKQYHQQQIDDAGKSNRRKEATKDKAGLLN